MLPSRDGVFHGFITEKAVATTGKNNLVTFQAKYRLTEERVNGEWYALREDEPFEITGYHYLEKKDGTVNTNTVDQLKDAIGWDGADPFWLDDADLSGACVTLKIEREEWEGKVRPKVKWLSNENDTGGGDIKRLDDAERRAIKNRIGAKFKAVAGGTAVKTAPPMTAAPTRPASPASSPKRAAAPTRAKAPTPEPETAVAVAEPPSADVAFAAFQEAFASDVDGKIIEREWFKRLGELFPSKGVDTLTPDDWAKFMEEGPKNVCPF